MNTPEGRRKSQRSILALLRKNNLNSLQQIRQNMAVTLKNDIKFSTMIFLRTLPEKSPDQQWKILPNPSNSGTYEVLSTFLKSCAYDYWVNLLTRCKRRDLSSSLSKETSWHQGSWFVLSHIIVVRKLKYIVSINRGNLFWTRWCRFEIIYLVILTIVNITMFLPKMTKDSTQLTHGFDGMWKSVSWKFPGIFYHVTCFDPQWSPKWRLIELIMFGIR